MRRLLAVGLIALSSVASLALATPAQAADATGQEAFVVLSGRAEVPAEQEVGDLVVFHGSSSVDGTVNGSLTAFDAPVTVSGRVNGDVVVFRGRVELRDGAVVTGDVVSEADPVVAPGATIEGATRRVQTHVNWDGFGWAGRLLWWLAISVSTLLIGLLFIWLLGRGAAVLAETGLRRAGPAVGFGLLAFFGLPILAILALVTLVGIPFGLGLLSALGLIYALGYSASAWVLGRRLIRAPAPWAVAFLVGWLILRVLALIPFVGAVVSFVAIVFGLGALVVALWRARSRGPAAPAPAPAPA